MGKPFYITTTLPYVNSDPPRSLLTDLISHAEADQPARLGDIWNRARIWGDTLTR